MQGLSEGLAFGVNAGLDGLKVFDVISKGAAGSWQMINRHQTMLDNEFEFGFAVDWMRKDLGLCMEIARRTEDTSIRSSLLSRIFTTGVVTGEYGLAIAYEEKADGIKSYLQDSDERVRHFARELIAKLHSTANAERQRVDEQMQIRRIEFEG